VGGGKCHKTLIVTASISGDPSCSGLNGPTALVKCEYGEGERCLANRWSSIGGADDCQRASSVWTIECRGPYNGSGYDPADGYYRAYSSELVVVARAPQKGTCPPAGDWPIERNAPGCTIVGNVITVAHGEAEIDPCPPAAECPTDCSACAGGIVVDATGFVAPDDDLNSSEAILSQEPDEHCIWYDDPTSPWELLCEDLIWYYQDRSTHGTRTRWKLASDPNGDCPNVTGVPQALTWVSGSADVGGAAVTVQLL
jgi:hypothetical protein